MNRRTFLHSTGALGLALAARGWLPARAASSRGLQLSFKPYTLQLKHAFTLATSSRTTTPVVLTQIQFEGVTGYGEASMPPYLGESHQSVQSFLSKLDLSQFKDPFQLEEILAYVDGVAEHNPAAKASVDIALHDLTARLLGKPLYEIWGYNPAKAPLTSYTIGIDTPEVVRQKTQEASEFKILKLKLGRDTDKQLVEAVRSVTQVPICVDVNQGWKDRQHALDMAHWLKEKGCTFVEQPMPKEQIDDLAWLTEHSPLPIMGDEGVQRLPDVRKAFGVYSGINVKLMKSTGLREGRQMLETARALGMRLMVGCMTETSCAISAASQLSMMVEWADLDGALLIGNDVFDGTTVVDGRLKLTDTPGIGVTPRATATT